MNNEKLLHEEIKTELDALIELEVGTDEYKATIDGVTKLFDRAIAIDKLNIETSEREKDRKLEEELKLKQMEEDKKNREFEALLKLKQMDEDKRDRFVKDCMTAASIVLPLAVTIWGTIKSIEFEKTGTITTIMGRGFITKLLPKK